MKNKNQIYTTSIKIAILKITSRTVFLLVFLIFSILVMNHKPAIGANLAEEFLPEERFNDGIIVSLKQDNPDDVEYSSLINSEYLLGVVNSTENNTVTYAKDNAKIAVTLTGEVLAFVSDVNGEPQIGDFIGASWLEGVGMKALTQNNQKLVGVALESFDSDSAVAYGQIDTPEGQKEVTIDSVMIRLFDKEGSVVSQSQSGVEGLLESVAGKQVSPIKLLFVTLIFVFGVVIAGFIVTASIRGSFVSIGRNPLASDSIYKSLVHVTFVSVIIILIGTSLAYVVLVI